MIIGLKYPKNVKFKNKIIKGERLNLELNSYNYFNMMHR